MTVLVTRPLGGTVKLRLAATTALVAIALAGCGDVKPGVAVDVDGEQLSMTALDDQARDYCTLLAAGSQLQEGQGAPATGDARRDVASSFIVSALAQQVADDEGVEVPRSRTVLPPAQLEQAEQALGAATVRRVRPILEEQARTSALVAAIGAERTGFDYAGASDEELAAAQQQLLQAGSEQLQAALGDADVTIDPRLGLDPQELSPTGSGSLSVEVTERPQSAPAGQTCA